MRLVTIAALLRHCSTPPQLLLRLLIHVLALAYAIRLCRAKAVNARQMMAYAVTRVSFLVQVEFITRSEYRDYKTGFLGKWAV